MASNSRIILSLFDRLTNLDPKATVDAPRNEWEQMAALTDSVARDLTDLLNTRIDGEDFPEAQTELRRSVAAYGVQDYTRSPVDLDKVRFAIERAVKTFEPRLARAQVQVAPVAEPQLQVTLQFRITAQLKADLGAEPLVFDADLAKETRRIQVNKR